MRCTTDCSKVSEVKIYRCVNSKKKLEKIRKWITSTRHKVDTESVMHDQMAIFNSFFLQTNEDISMKF